VPLAGLSDATGWRDDAVRSRRVAMQLVADGLARVDGEQLRLP
jgi:hypothetical protein